MVLNTNIVQPQARLVTLLKQDSRFPIFPALHLGELIKPHKYVNTYCLNQFQGFISGFRKTAWNQLVHLHHNSCIAIIPCCVSSFKSYLGKTQTPTKNYNRTGTTTNPRLTYFNNGALSLLCIHYPFYHVQIRGKFPDLQLMA